MKDLRFWLKLTFFGLPFFILVIIVWAILAYIGDGLPFSDVIRRQIAGEIQIYEPGWSRENTIAYKVLALMAHDPEIAVIGSSRSQSVRSLIFNIGSDRFYNASASALEVSDMHDMIQYWEREGALPPYLFVAIDFPRFLGSFLEIAFNPEIRVDTLYELHFATGRIPDTLANLIYRPITVYNFVDRVNINPTIRGELALTTGAGYRVDGSFYTPNVEQGIAERLQAHDRYFQNRERMFQSGHVLDEATFADFRSILEMADRQGTTIIGYIPPIREAYYREMLLLAEYDYINDGVAQLQTYFDALDMPLFDFREMASFGGNDQEFYDSWHPGELANARMFAHMLANLPALDGYVDLDQLNQTILNSPDNFYPFGRNP